jgi:hypothetical protein
MRGNVIGKKGLDIYRDPSAGFYHPLTFSPDNKQLSKIFVPFMRIIVRILCIGMAEVIWRGRNDEIDAVVGNVRQNGLCISTDNAIYKPVNIGRLICGNAPPGIP